MVGYKKAIELLHAASTPGGFVAAIQEEDNYRRIWTRDSALCGLAALSTDDEALKETFKKSIETIFRNQHPAGFIPSNVSPVGHNVSYGNVVGRVDNHAWIVISACTYSRLQNEGSWLQNYSEHISRALELMNAWEFNGRGLMYVPQSADWADEYYNHGYILYNQLLRLWALRCAAAAFPDKNYDADADRIQQAIETYFGNEKFYAPQLERLKSPKDIPYWPMGFNTSAYYTRFDLQANALALLLNIGTAHNRQRLLQFMKELSASQDSLLPSFHPVVREEDKEMHDLKNNFAYRFRNKPYEFHNGGLWSVWNGFMSMSIAKYDEVLAVALRKKIDEACAQKDWDFNECHHGETHQPIGVSKCAWSAAGLILSYHHSFASQLEAL
jgi:GH15 family glucan-1,4-alpha-glucosidase